MTPDELRLWALDAEALQQNRVWRAVWLRLEDYMESRALGCDTNRDPSVAQDIIRCKQLIKALQREAERIIEDGEVAAIQLAEIDKSRKSRIFRR